jgi:hypothetical protein
LADRTPGDHDQPWAYTAVNEAGEPVEVAFARTDHYLTKPVKWGFWPGRKVVEHDRPFPLGSLCLQFGSPEPERANVLHGSADLAKARVVTVDLSVLLAGLDPAKFRANDMLFVCEALVIETAWYSSFDPDGANLGMGRVWEHSLPVPADDHIFSEYQGMKWLKPAFPGMLTNTDLLCAATAVVYRCPMYTAQPDAYEGVCDELQGLEYGRTLNPEAESRGGS